MIKLTMNISYKNLIEFCYKFDEMFILKNLIQNGLFE